MEDILLSSCHCFGTKCYAGKQCWGPVDKGVKKMLSFLLARNIMHQNQWIAAIKELEEKDGVVTPASVP